MDDGSGDFLRFAGGDFFEDMTPLSTIADEEFLFTELGSDLTNHRDRST
jgi:hypothetical protein